MRYVLLGLGFFTFMLIDAQAQTVSTTAERRVCWSSNAGFFVDTPSGDILIDAILSSDDAIARAEEPFDEVRLIFVSHVHGDHFNAAGLRRHLAANAKAHLIVTPQSYAALKRSGWEAAWDERVTVALPDWEVLEAFEADTYAGHIMRFDHGATENIGVAVAGPDVRLLYAAGGWYSDERVAQLEALYPETDLVIANVWPLGNAAYVDSIHERFAPAWLLMAHHAGRQDGIVRRNGGAERMEQAMSRAGMQGRIFGRRMACEPF